MKVSVIVTTYNSPEWLDKVIWGFSVQTHTDFELLVADDGSDATTQLTVARLAELTKLDLRHVWQEDQGFRKCEILNKAIEQSASDYLVFTDGDCIPRRDFLETHVRLAEPGHFLSGGLVRLPLKLSEQLTTDDIVYGRATDRKWLHQHGLRLSKKSLLLTTRPRLAVSLDRVTTTGPTFNGHNASVWKDDILRVNGFDERLAYGGLDRELGERLVNAGVRPKQIRHRAVCVHLDHERGYFSKKGVQQNLSIRRDVRDHEISWTECGIYKGQRRVSGDQLAGRAVRRRA